MKDKCPLEIPDWINFLNDRIAIQTNLIFAKRAMDMALVTRFISVVAILLVGTTSIFEFFEVHDVYLDSLFLSIFVLSILFIFIYCRKNDKDFKEFFKFNIKDIGVIDNIIERIMNNELNISEKIRDEYLENEYRMKK